MPDAADVIAASFRTRPGTASRAAASWHETSPAAVLDLIAGCAADALPAVAESLGQIILRREQRDAASRLVRLLRERGGAVLADPPGSGKTYAALAVARILGPAAIVAPAVLKQMWHNAAARAKLGAIPFTSVESLGRRGWTVPRAVASASLLIVDEAHNVRNPRTQRWRALAALCAEKRTLLLTATPVHNSHADLTALLALFLGSAAREAGDTDFVVRRPLASDRARPAVRRCGVMRVKCAGAILNEILALPPPLHASLHPRAESAGALATMGLLRAWASSDGALRAALRRRLTRASAITVMLRSGELPTRASLARWIVDDGVVQLGLPGLDALSGDRPLGEIEAAKHLETVERHETALRALIRCLDGCAAHTSDAGRASRKSSGSHNPDTTRAAHLARLLRDPELRVVAFSHSAETARSMFRELRREAGVALLTGSGARVAGGAIPRQEVLARFAPRAQGAKPVQRAHEVRLLLATDLLAEGVNLQDANVIVHLDLPWTAARLIQREGRVVRQGSVHRQVRIYRMGAPVPARRFLGIERRLQLKARSAREALGLRLPQVSSEVWAAVEGGERLASDSERVLTLLGQLGECAAQTPRRPPHAVQFGVPVSAVGANRSGAVVLVRHAGRLRLLAVDQRGAASDAAGRIAPLLEAVVTNQPAEASARHPMPAIDHHRVLAALNGAERWLAARLAGAAVGMFRDAAGGAVARKAARVAQRLLNAAGRHQRAGLAPLASAVGTLASRPLPAAIEAELEALLVLDGSI
ncbi:MAG TPA: DEAD/DEAH box helicase, partial [Gemmatimonadales bacterium]|nr:DEAD/DEAH box helicase [Gemmatimonadales bacterium]